MEGAAIGAGAAGVASAMSGAATQMSNRGWQGNAGWLGFAAEWWKTLQVLQNLYTFAFMSICGWSVGFFRVFPYWLPFVGFHYDLSLFTSHTHEMYLHILVQRYQTSQVSRQVPVTPSQQPCSSFISISSNSTCNSPTPSLIQDVTKARTVQNG